jgi:hypothetical protein
MSQRRGRYVRNQFGVFALVVLSAGLIGGCATQAATTPTAPSAAPTGTLPVQPAAITEKANNTTVHLRTGQVVRISLQNTYWSDPVSAPAAVLTADGPVSRVSSGHCPVGGGCGTVSVTFRAARTGTAQLEAHRSSCGEAMACGPGQGQFTVTVVVT